MIVKKTIKPGSRLSAESLARLRAIRDEDIDYSDIPASTDAELARAVEERRRRGGARRGAGRKPQAKPSERFTITLPHDLAAKVHSAAKRKHMKDASFLAELVATHA